jgi:hypothetical protein
VVNITALFPFWAAKISQSYLLFSGSRPVEGSSRYTILGSETREMATERRLFIPPLRELVLKCLNLPSITLSIASSTFYFSFAGTTPLSLA